LVSFVPSKEEYSTSIQGGDYFPQEWHRGPPHQSGVAAFVLFDESTRTDRNDRGTEPAGLGLHRRSGQHDAEERGLSSAPQDRDRSDKSAYYSDGGRGGLQIVCRITQRIFQSVCHCESFLTPCVRTVQEAISTNLQPEDSIAFGRLPRSPHCGSLAMTLAI
jgi:hypothetical protein